jgi:hypothetical protein
MVAAAPGRAGRRRAHRFINVPIGGQSGRGRGRDEARAPIDGLPLAATWNRPPTCAKAAHRRSVAQVLVRRALTEAAARAKDAS